MPKIWVGRKTLNGEKNEDGLRKLSRKKILKVRLNVFTSEDLITGKTIVKKKKFSKYAWMCLRVTTSVTFTTIAMHEAQVYTSGRGAQGARRGKK